MTWATSAGSDVRLSAVARPMPPRSGPIAATTLEVCIGPGATALTRTFDSANSAAQVWGSDSSAARSRC